MKLLATTVCLWRLFVVGQSEVAVGSMVDMSVLLQVCCIELCSVDMIQTVCVCVCVCVCMYVCVCVCVCVYVCLLTGRCTLLHKLAGNDYAALHFPPHRNTTPTHHTRLY